MFVFSSGLFCEKLLKYLPGYEENFVYGVVNLKNIINNDIIKNTLIALSGGSGDFEEVSKVFAGKIGINAAKLNKALFFVKHHGSNGISSSRSPDVGVIVVGKFDQEILFKGAKVVKNGKLNTYVLGPLKAMVIKGKILVLATTAKALTTVLDRFRKKGTGLSQEIKDIFSGEVKQYFVKIFAHGDTSALTKLHPAFALMNKAGPMAALLPKYLSVTLLHNGKMLKLDTKVLTSFTDTFLQVMIGINTENQLIKMIMAYATPSQLAGFSKIFSSNFTKARGNARLKACQANMKFLEAALEMYYMDNPPPEGMTSVIVGNGESVKDYPLKKGGYVKSWPVCKEKPGVEYIVRKNSKGIYVECPIHGTLSNFKGK